MQYQSSNKVIGKKQCPNCASIGNDRSKDNLILYSDEGAHCFNCGYHIHSNGSIRSRKKAQSTELETIGYDMPSDVDTCLPGIAISWLNDYHLSIMDMTQHQILWSEKMKWLVFPIKIDNNIIGYQARNFNIDKPYKWITKFKKNNYIKVIDNYLNSNLIVLVEDIISSIRVSNIYNIKSIPLFGSFVNDNLYRFLKQQKLPVAIWLDRDKAKDAILFSGKARSLGLSCRTIITDLDPKAYTNNELKGYLNV